MPHKSVFSIMLIIALLSAIPVFAQDGPPTPELTGEIILDGLTSPQGLFVDADGTLWAIDAGLGGDEAIDSINPNNFEIVPGQFGYTSQIVRLAADGEPEVVANLPSVFAADESIGGARVTVVDGVVYATVGAWQINQGEEVTTPLFGTVVRIDEGEATAVADLWAYELANNPDETGNIESHPYGIIGGNNGLLFIADAAANALFSVDPATGEVQTIASFEGLPGVFPSQFRNGELLTDPVPTNVVANEDGSFYVSFLSGAPFVPGSAKVVRVSADGEVSDFATGLTMVVDLTRGPDGNLYAVQFGMFTQQGPVPNSGAVIRIFEDGTWEPVIVGLPFATAIAVDGDGNGYVAINGVTIPSAGAVVYYEGLTSMEATEMPMGDMPPMDDMPVDDMAATAEPSN